ncbi:MAG: phytanoyl-CoA dioxygenase family protein [Myxococcales bacterium]|nr:phytanoyl-CoA dioxygenase family protein [Myxococcales bacterium]
MLDQLPNRPASPSDLRANRVISIPDFHLEGQLTPEQIDFFEVYGFIRFKQFVPRERANELYQALLELTDELVKKGVDQINGVPLIKGKRDDGSPYFGRIPFASLQHPEFAKFLRDPRFQAIIDQLAPGSRLGEDERDGLVVNRFRNEPGAKYKNLGWHTDSLRDLAYFEKPRRYLNVGFSITDSPMKVGGLRVLPCTHNQSIASMLTTKIHFFDMEPDPNELAIETEAGDLTIHDGRIWHRTALAEVTGDASERCVTYLPIMDGPVIKKHEKSPTPVYFHLKKFLGY